MSDTEKQLLENLSAAVFGNLCEYIRLFGCPYQIRHIKDMLNNVLSDQTQTTTRDIVYWKTLRQRAYELAGDWLWMHATNHYRVKIAPQMKIPTGSLDTLLSVESVKDGYGLIHNSNSNTNNNNNAKTASPGKKKPTNTIARKSDRHKKRNRNYDDGNEEDITAGTTSDGNDTKGSVATWILRDHEIEGLEEYFEPDPASSTASTKKKQKDSAQDEEEKTVDTPPFVNNASEHLGVTLKEDDGSFSATFKAIPIGNFSTKKEAAIAVDLYVMFLSVLGINNNVTNQSMNIIATTLETWENTLKSKYSETLEQIKNRFGTNEKQDEQIISDADLSALKLIIEREVEIWVKCTSPEDKIPVIKKDNSSIFDALLAPDSIQELNFISKIIHTSHHTWMPSLYYVLFLYPISPSEYNTHPSYPKLLHKICIISCRILYSILSSHESSLTWKEYNPEEQKVIVVLISICKLSDTDNNIGTTSSSSSSSSSTLLLSSICVLANLLQEVNNSSFPIVKCILSKIPQLQNNEQAYSDINNVTEELLKKSETIVAGAQTWINKILKKNKNVTTLPFKECMVLDLEDCMSVIGELNYMQFLECIEKNL